MKLSLDRSLRVIWLLIGILLLLFLLAGSVMVATQLIGNLGAGESAVRVASQAQAPRDEPRAVRFGAPQTIRGTATRVASVEYGRAHEPDSYGLSGSGGYREPALVNLIFLDGEGARLLLDRPAFIADWQGPPADGAARSWIAYRIALEDANGDGRLDGRDPAALYVTDLEGRNLRPVIRPPLRVKDYRALDASRMLVYALEPPAGQPNVAEERWRQRAFIYDVTSGTLSPHAALDSAAARARQILAR